MPEGLYKFMNQNGGKPYYYKGQKIGIPSWDWHTFILWRKAEHLKIRMYPGTIPISTTILMDFITKGCKLVIVQVDGEAKYKIDPKDWLEKGIIGTLYNGQEPHAFMPLRLFQTIGK